MNKIAIAAVILLLLPLALPLPALAAGNTSATDLMPNWATGWNALPPKVQDTIKNVFSIALVALGVVCGLKILFGASNVSWGGARNDATRTSAGYEQIFTGVVIFVIAIAALFLLLYIASTWV